MALIEQERNRTIGGKKKNWPGEGNSTNEKSAREQPRFSWGPVRAAPVEGSEERHDPSVEAGVWPTGRDAHRATPPSKFGRQRNLNPVDPGAVLSGAVAPAKTCSQAGRTGPLLTDLSRPPDGPRKGEAGGRRADPKSRQARAPETTLLEG